MHYKKRKCKQTAPNTNLELCRLLYRTRIGCHGAGFELKFQTDNLLCFIVLRILLRSKHVGLQWYGGYSPQPHLLPWPLKHLVDHRLSVVQTRAAGIDEMFPPLKSGPSSGVELGVHSLTD